MVARSPLVAALVLAGAGLLALAPSRALAANDGLACGRRLVSLGDPAAQVLDRCGPPDMRTSRVETRFLRGRPFYVTIDEWMYKRGARDFSRLALFENGRLVSVEAISR